MAWSDYKKANAYTVNSFLADWGNAPLPIRTCVPDYDKHLGGGYRPGLHLIGGRAAVGKSAFALYLAMVAAACEQSVLYVSLEMSAADCMARCCSCLSVEVDGLAPFRFTEYARMGREMQSRGGIAKADGEPVFLAARALDRKCAGLAVTDRRELHDLRHLTAEIAKAAENGASIVFVDYLHRVLADGKGDSVENTKAVSGELNGAGLECGVPVVALSALGKGRAVELDAFRDSSALYYDALSASILERDGDLQPDGSRRLALHVVKSRNGYETDPDGPIGLRYWGAYNRFEPI